MAKDDKIRYWAMIAHQIIVRVCTALALYSTLVFMLSSMYLKTALTQPHFTIELYDEYSNETAGIRSTAFWAMIVAFLMYMMSVGLLFFYSLHDRGAIIGSIGILAVLIVMIVHVIRMIQQAGQIFMPIE